MIVLIILAAALLAALIAALVDLAVGKPRPIRAIMNATWPRG